MVKRTITENHLARLQAQCEEAKTLQLTKVATNLDHQIVATAPNIRDDEAEYTYSNVELHQDVSDALWSAATRISDYLGRVPDAQEVQSIIDKFANELFDEMCVVSSVTDGVGAYEPLVPGEARDKVVLEVKESE